MKKLYIIVSALSLGVCTSACSYFDTDGAFDTGGFFDFGGEPEMEEPVSEANIVPQRVDLPQNYSANIAQRSGGSVQVFSLDGGPQNQVGAPIVQQGDNIVMSMKQEGDEVLRSEANEPATMSAPVSAPVQKGNSFSSNVEVFPLPGSGSFVQARPVTSFAQPTSSQFVSLSSGGNQPVIIYFDHDSVFLNEADRSKIADVAQVYQTGFSPEILVEGHASATANFSDPVQRHTVNLKISMDRAFAVARALMQNGVPAEKIRTKAYGDTVPAASASGLSSEAASRRVEVSGGR